MEDLEKSQQSHHFIMGKSGSSLGVLSVINEHNNRLRRKLQDRFLEMKKKLQGKL